MDIGDVNAFITLVTAEYRRRVELLPDDDDGTGLAYDQWMFTDLPFLHDLCILYLIAVRHHVERRLLYFASRVTGHSNEITQAEFIAARDSIMKKGMLEHWREIVPRLKPETCARHGSMEILRLLANSYKHDPHMQPGKKLIKALVCTLRSITCRCPKALNSRRAWRASLGCRTTRTSQQSAQSIKPRKLNFTTDIGH